MARKAAKVLADMRAIEEQAERSNPLDGRNKMAHNKYPASTSTEPYPSGGMRGCGATPSMGLSQFRGGMDRPKTPPAKAPAMAPPAIKPAHKAAKSRAVTPPAMAPPAAPPSIKAQRKALGKGMSGGMKHLGKMMAEHLHKTHGAGEYAEFAEGFLEGGGYFGEGTHKGEMRKTARKAQEGMGKLTIEHGEESEESEMEGCGELTIHHGGMGTGRYEGKGKKKRAAAGPNDKRRARAAVVKKVMQERGVGLGEASKIVKAEGLF